MKEGQFQNNEKWQSQVSHAFANQKAWTCSCCNKEMTKMFGDWICFNKQCKESK